MIMRKKSRDKEFQKAGYQGFRGIEVRRRNPEGPLEETGCPRSARIPTERVYCRAHHRMGGGFDRCHLGRLLLHVAAMKNRVGKISLATAGGLAPSVSL